MQLLKHTHCMLCFTINDHKPRVAAMCVCATYEHQITIITCIFRYRYISFHHNFQIQTGLVTFVGNLGLHKSHSNTTTVTKNRISFLSPVSQKAAELPQRAFIFWDCLGVKCLIKKRCISITHLIRPGLTLVWPRNELIIGREKVCFWR